LQFLAAVSGFVAAYKWYESSRVNFMPFEEVRGRLVPVPITDVAVWLNAVRWKNQAA
jgi:hypothetical protein